MLHFPPPPHLHAMHGAPPPMPPPITSIPPHMVPASVNRQMLHHQYQTTLARRQLRQQQVSNGGDIAYEASETTPICRCRVIYLGSSVPHVTKDGLQGIQEPLRDLYPEQGLLASATTESIGIDSWLSVWSNGILIENVDDSGREVKKFFPIDSLHYCAAVRYVVIPGANIDSSSTVASTSACSNTVSGVTNGLDSHHNKSSFNGQSVASNGTSDASELIASTGTSQHQQLHRSSSASTTTAAAAAAASSSSSHGQNGQNASVATDAKIKFLPLDSPFSRNSNTSIHPPLFACILRRTTGIKVLECHAFICKRDQAANALVRCCFHAYADSMHAKQMEAEIDNEQAESTYGAISMSDRRSRRSHLINGHSNSPDGPSGDSLGDGSPNYRASSSSSSNAQVNGKSRPSTRDNRHHKRSINGSTMSNGQGSIHLNDASANRFSRSISDLDSVENKIEAWRQRSTEALNMEAQQQQQQQKSSAVEAEIHTESPCSRLTRSRRALSSGAIAVQGTTLAEYRRRRSDDQYSDEEVEAIVDDEDDDDVENESAQGPKRVNGNNGNRNHIEGVYDNLDDEEDEVDEDEDGNYKVWHSRGRRGTDSGVGGVRSSDSTIADAAPSIRSARYHLSGGGSLMYPAAMSTPHLPSLPANHPMYHHPGHFIHFNGHRGTIARSGHMAPMPGHLTLAPFPFAPPAHHPAYLMDGRATLRSVRTTASSRAPTHFASGTLTSNGLNRPASVATSRSMTNLAPTGPIISPPPPPFFSPHGSPFFPVPSTLSKKELKNLKNTMKKLKKKSKSKGDHFIPFPPVSPGGTLGPHGMMRPMPPMALPPFANSNGHPHPHHHPHPHAHGHPAYAMAMHPSGRPMPMLMLPHSPPPSHPPPPHGHMMMQDEPIYVPTIRPMTPISIIPDSSVYNGALRNPKKDNNKLILNGTSKHGPTGKNISSKESSSSHRNSSSPGESISASGSKNNLLHQNYPSVHHSSNNRRSQLDSSSEQEVHSDSSGFNTGGIYRKKANLNERAFSYSIRQESRSRSNSIANVNFPPHSLGSGDEDSPASLAINGDSYSSTASSSLHNAMQRHSLIASSGVSSINGTSKSHQTSMMSNERQQQMNYYNKQNALQYTDDDGITEDLESLTLNSGYKANGGAAQTEMYYQQAQMMHSTSRNGYHDSSHDGNKVRQTSSTGGGGGGGNRCDSSLSSSTLQGNVKTASIKRGSGLSLHQLHASIASNGALTSNTSGSKIALTPVPPIPPHLLANVNGNHSTNGTTSGGHINGNGGVNGGSKVTSRSSSRENL